jgi:hypothetical protein
MIRQKGEEARKPKPAESGGRPSSRGKAQYGYRKKGKRTRLEHRNGCLYRVQVLLAQYTLLGLCDGSAVVHWSWALP